MCKRFAEAGSRRLTEHQPPLFADPVQPRRRKREAEGVYDAVVYLRKRGRKVYRAGRSMTIVDGHRMNHEHVIALAQALGFGRPWAK